MAPGWTDYNKRVPCQEYDVSGYLLRGENVIGAKLGDGWYCGHMFITERQFYGEFPELLLQLSVKTADGSEKSLPATQAGRPLRVPYSIRTFTTARPTTPAKSCLGGISLLLMTQTGSQWRRDRLATSASLSCPSTNPFG